MPEIIRSNLSDVILRMALLGIGPIEEFPFIDAPAGRAIADGYAHLRELGALTDENKLTDIGKKMAGLSIDCHVARMIIAGVREILARNTYYRVRPSVIDPRQRPPGKEKEADALHSRFTDPLPIFYFISKPGTLFTMNLLVQKQDTRAAFLRTAFFYRLRA